jgi:hypothetical protein
LKIAGSMKTGGLSLETTGLESLELEDFEVLKRLDEGVRRSIPLRS